MFITAIWKDYRLAWDPAEFGGLTESRIPSLQIWRPDIVLYNNDDGKYDPTLPTNVVLKNTGVCEWLPPAIYKSDCKIHIDLFPFDWQNCTMVFRSYTYDRSEIRFKAEYKKTVIDRKGMKQNNLKYLLQPLRAISRTYRVFHKQTNSWLVQFLWSHKSHVKKVHGPTICSLVNHMISE